MRRPREIYSQKQVYNRLKKQKLGCVLMAAGNASRFGENKLLADFMGKPLVEHALSAIPKGAFKRVVVVSQYPSVLELGETYGFDSILNPDPAAGISRTITLGLDAIGEVDAAMFMVADQPCLRQETVLGELEFYQQARPGHIVAMGYGKRRGNPAIFPKSFFGELRALSAENGGSHVICAHEDALLLYQVDQDVELRDIDCKQELEQLKAEVSKPF
ncbi:MAG: nucleotidyltransferase family protein [Clostridia bacterium]|nr:nucleotidyltransferase family protein [Clostridia bacterium]